MWAHPAVRANMERLAARGIRFNNFCAMSVCSPTRISLMTGQNAARHRTTNWINPDSNNGGPLGPPEWNWMGLKPGDVTLAALLRAAGLLGLSNAIVARVVGVSESHISRMAKGGSTLAPYHNFDAILPADVKDLVEKKKTEILEGNFRVDVDENTPVSD